MATENAIEIRELSKKYKSQIAVNRIDLDVQTGKIFGFLGPNGAGKTTTIKMIAGLTDPLEGEIKILGNKCYFGSSKGRESLGYLPDVPECYGYMRPMEYLKLCGELYNIEKNLLKKKSEELLDLVGLYDVNKKIGTFSRGMKQRMGIAQALINDPKVVFMDEPASALDPTGRYEVMEILNKLKGKTTVFFSTHIISDIEKVCDEVAIINKGVILERGTIDGLKNQYDKKDISFSISNLNSNEKNDQRAIFLDKLSSSDWFEEKIADNGPNFKIRVNNREKAQIEIVKLLSQNSMGLEKFDSLAISLEDIFLEVVKQ